MARHSLKLTILAWIAMAGVVLAQTLPNLPAASSPSSSDQTYLYQGTTLNRATLSQIISGGGGTLNDLSNIAPNAQPSVANSLIGLNVTPQFAAIGFGGNWYSGGSWAGSYAAAHADTRFTQVFSHVTTGSQQASSPGAADFALGTLSSKLNYLTSTVLGEVDGDYIITRQGMYGDLGGLLIDARKVGTNGGITPIEIDAFTINSSGAALAEVDTIPGFVENGSTPVGYHTECRQGSCFAALQGRLFDDSAGANVPSWTNYIYFSTSRSTANRNYLVDGSGKTYMGTPTAQNILYTDGSANFHLQNTSGADLLVVSPAGAATITGAAAAQAISSSGSTAGFSAADRTTTGSLLIYRTGGLNRLYDSSYGSALTWDGGGRVSIPGTLGLNPVTWADNQTCTAGQISVDATYIYVCTATNTVKRVALSAF